MLLLLGSSEEEVEEDEDRGEDDFEDEDVDVDGGEVVEESCSVGKSGEDEMTLSSCLIVCC